MAKVIFTVNSSEKIPKSATPKVSRGGEFYIGICEDYKRWATQVRSAYPDLHYTIEDMIAEGEQVVIRSTFRGTNTGEIVTPMPIPATGKQVTTTEVLIVRFAYGKVVALWSEAEYLGVYQQLGLIPAPQPGG